MRDSQDDATTPAIQRLGSRRVRTEPSEGQGEEPDIEGKSKDSRDNDDRLKADKPPHY
jgi:hypothetical protein